MDVAAVTKKCSRSSQYIATITTNIATFANACILAWPAVAIPLLESPSPPIGGEPMTKYETSWIASVVCITAVFTIPISNEFRKRYGNKITGYLSGILYCIHWITIISAKSKTLIYVSRVFGGLGASGIFVLCPTYVSEIAQDDVRGTLGSLFVLMFNAGLVFAYTIGAFFSYRTIAILCLIIPLLFILCFLWIPESPVYLLSKGKILQATDSLKWLRGKSEDFTEEINRLKINLQNTKRSKSMSIKEMFSDKATKRGLLIITVFAVNNQLTGVYIILCYAVNIFIEAGSTIPPSYAAIIIGVLQLIGSYISTFLVDRLGRRILIIVSNIGISLALGMLGVYSYMKDTGIDVLNIGWLPVVSLSLYMVALSIGVSSLPFVLVTELFLPGAQTFATNLTYIILWLGGFLLSTFFTVLTDAMGLYGCYWIFSVSCALGAIFTYFIIPETKGKCIDDIYRELGGGDKHGDKNIRCEYTAAPTESM